MRIALYLWPVVGSLVVWLECVAQPFQIDSIQLDAQRRVQVTVPGEPNSYFRLLTGTSLTNISNVVTVSLSETLLTTQPPTDTQAFYRVQRLPVAWPLDSDGDGIDDVWELRYRHAGAALNGADADEDHTADGRHDIQDYLDTAPLIAAFVSPNSRYLESTGAAGIEVRFNRQYSGPLKFQIGGTAIAGQDFNEAYTKPAGEFFTGLVMVDGTSVTIPVLLRTNDFIDLDRSVVLTLQQPAATNGYRPVTPSTHILTITDGDRGIFGGAIFLTNGVLLSSQPVKLALRSGSSGGTAFLDTSGATLFQRRPVILPVQFTGQGTSFTPLNAATGSLPSDVLGRALNWRLELIQPLVETNKLSARVTLRLLGLSVTGREIVAQGVLVANRLDATQ